MVLERDKASAVVSGTEVESTSVGTRVALDFFVDGRVDRTQWYSQSLTAMQAKLGDRRADYHRNPVSTWSDGKIVR